MDFGRYEIKNSDQQNFDFADIQIYLRNPDKCFKRGTHLNETLKNAENSKNPSGGFEVGVNPPEGLSKPQTDDKKIHISSGGVVSSKTSKGVLVTSEISVNAPLPDINHLNKTIKGSILQIKENIKTLTSPNISNFEQYGSFDFEWYRPDLPSNIDTGTAGLIYCATFVDQLGNTTTLHLKDFNNNPKDFINAVLTEMRKYSALIGFSILEKESSLKKKGGISGDIETLEKNCYVLGPEIEQRLSDVMDNTKLLDIYPLFTSEHTKGILSAAE